MSLTSTDFDVAEETFATSTDGTVGIEEEFALLDPQSLDLAPRFEELRDSATGPLSESISGELISSEIEIRSGRGADVDHAIALQHESRRALFSHAADHGVALGSTGTHPWSDYREQRNIDTEHYRRVVDGLQYVARRNNTFSLHVHVGVRDLDRAVRVCDRLRTVLPTLLAISASSPFLDARDSGLHSARTQAFTRMFPRCGVPDAYGSWAAYREYLEMLVRTGGIVEYTQVWWSIRPHIAFGTVEVRICDAQPTAQEADALTRLIAGCVTQAAREVDGGWGLAPTDHVPRRLIEENMWRAIRYGQDGDLLDLATLEAHPAADAVERLAAWAQIPPPGLPELNGAQRQRRMLAAGATMQETFAASVEETRATYSEGAVTT